MALSRDDAKDLISRRHPEWTEHQELWRRLLDSYEGGQRYAHADYFRGPFDAASEPWYSYGWEETTGEGYPCIYGQISKRNLIPYKSETSRVSRDGYVQRLARTPVPALVRRVVRKYLSRIYARQVKRIGPDQLASWWGNVNGKRTPIREWMRKQVGPLLLTLGQIDLVFNHPETPEGEAVESLADLKRLGLDGCIADYLLPENVVWWRKDCRDQYLELLVFERHAERGVLWRHWHAGGADVYKDDGEHCPEMSFEYPYGRPPIVRCYDERKLRCKHVGQSRMEPISELMRSIYNRTSELIVADTFNSHSLLQAPIDFLQADAKVPIGPDGLLPMIKTDGGGYQGFEYVKGEQSGQAECRTHILDDQEAILAEAALLQPAGMSSTTTGQSGISKIADQAEGNDVLSEIALTLQNAESEAARMALVILTNGKATPAELDAVVVEYPVEYALYTAADLATALADVQAIITAAGMLPETEGELLKRLISVVLPGLEPDRLGELHSEIDDAVSLAAERMDGKAEADEDDDEDDDGANLRAGGTTEDPSLALPPNASQQISELNAAIAPDLSQ